MTTITKYRNRQGDTGYAIYNLGKEKGIHEEKGKIQLYKRKKDALRFVAKGNKKYPYIVGVTRYDSKQKPFGSTQTHFKTKESQLKERDRLNKAGTQGVFISTGYATRPTHSARRSGRSRRSM